MLRTQKQKNKQTVTDISTTCLSACVDNNSKYASYPDWRISPHADRQWPRNTNSLQEAVTDHAVASFSHHTWSAAVQQVCPTRLTTVLVIYFSIFDLRGLPWAKVHQKRRWPTAHLDLPSYKISAQSRKQSTRYVLPKFSFSFGPMSTHTWDIHYQKSCGQKIKQKTSTPVIRTSIIPTCRSPSPPVVGSLSHGPCDCPASLSHLANESPNALLIFQFLAQGG